MLSLPQVNNRLNKQISVSQMKIMKFFFENFWNFLKCQISDIVGLATLLDGAGCFLLVKKWNFLNFKNGGKKPVKLEKCVNIILSK